MITFWQRLTPGFSQSVIFFRLHRMITAGSSRCNKSTTLSVNPLIASLHESLAEGGSKRRSHRWRLVDLLTGVHAGDGTGGRRGVTPSIYFIHSSTLPGPVQDYYYPDCHHHLSNPTSSHPLSLSASLCSVQDTVLFSSQFCILIFNREQSIITNLILCGDLSLFNSN